MDDLIGVQEAIDAIERIFDRCEEIESHFPDGDPDKTGYKMLPDYFTVWKYLHQPPSAERHGRWKNEIDTGTEMMACSVCGARVVKQPYISAVGSKGYAYCPYCGARMDLDEVTER